MTYNPTHYPTALFSEILPNLFQGGTEDNDVIHIAQSNYQRRSDMPFDSIVTMTGGGPGRQSETLAIFMYKQSFGTGKLGYGSAISVAMLLIVGALSLIYLRLLREPK